MQNIPTHIFEQIREAIRRPEGTFTFEYTSVDLFNPQKAGGIILQIPAGGHLFRLERSDDLLLHFYHSSPGTGTRVATIDLKTVPPCNQVFLCFSWTPTETALHIGPRIEGAALYSASGTSSKRQFIVGIDGSVFQIGDEGVNVMEASIYESGKPVLLPTAMEAWNNIIKAVEIMGTGTSQEGYLYEVVVANLSLSILVTGFESYTKKRFVELEQEGIAPDTSLLVKTFFPKKELEAGIADILSTEATESGKSLLAHIVDRRVINFQNYSDCKKSYNKTYNLRFGEMGVDSETLKKLQDFIGYRHRVIHISPLIAMLNQAEVPPAEPVFASKSLLQEAKRCFQTFITKLHESTLMLKRVD